ncbi:MAG: hypothetical protein ACTSQJ_03825 [Promethearchaeota archaeon]
MNIQATYFFEKNSGILLYSNVKIYELINSNPAQWINHSFIRQLDDYPDLSEDNQDGETKDFFTMIGEFLYQNAIPLIMLGLIILSTIVSILVIRRRNLTRNFEEFKEIMKKEKLKIQRQIKN